MGLTRWFRRRPSDDEMREELEAHVAMRAEHNGVDAAAARRRLGNVLHTRESMRRVWIARWWDELRQDAWFTWRSWRHRPGFALGTILVLALGLGASTALFAAVDSVLFRPLPYAGVDRLVSVGVLAAEAGASFAGQVEGILDKAYVQVWKTTPAPFESVTTMDTATCVIAEGQPERTRCGTVEHNFLRVLGVRVALGRDFVPEDDVRRTPRVALITHGLWFRRYGRDPDVVGRRISLEFDGFGQFERVPIVGVLPPDFEMPVESADVLLPSRLRPSDPKIPFPIQIMAFGRLKPGVTAEAAELMLAPQLPEIQAFWPLAARIEWKVQPVRARRVGDAARVAWLLIGAVAVFLLIACVNVANLLLARVAERQREFAVRAAIGAGEIRLARLALAEAALLSGTAGGVGLLLAFALLKTFVAVAPSGIPGIADASIDARVFAVAGLLVVATGMAIGIWPAISVFRAGGMRGLRSTGASSPGAKPRVRFALVTAQIALTMALLGSSALLLRTLWNVVNVPLGFDAARVVSMTIALSPTRYPTAERETAFFESLLARARQTPGAVSAALSDAPPPPRPPRGGTQGMGVDGRPADFGVRRHPTIGIREVTPDYFETFRIPLVRGRTLGPAEPGGEPAVVVNESAGRILFPDGRAIGRRIQPLPQGGRWSALYTVVGVTSDVRNAQNVTDEPLPEIYVLARPGAWAGGPIGRLALRTTARSADAAAYLRQIVADLDPREIVTIQTVDELLTILTARPRFIASLLTAFAALALLLAAAGLYSVASYLVLQRRRDIGVRMAIGASPRDVARLVVGEAGRWIIVGALLGCALGWTATRVLQSQLYEVEALDPWSWMGALLALAVVLVIAVFRPAYRAAHVEPVSALRAD
jgi:putative ABC transport system permease protein